MFGRDLAGVTVQVLLFHGCGVLKAMKTSQGAIHDAG
jgi:hypothetical protein